METCQYCGKQIVTREELAEDSDAGCSGMQALQVDPYLAEVHDDYTLVMLCPGRWQDRKDDI